MQGLYVRTVLVHSFCFLNIWWEFAINSMGMEHWLGEFRGTPWFAIQPKFTADSSGYAYGCS